MSGMEQPKIYLITPPLFDTQRSTSVLSAVLDSVEVACLRFSPPSKDETQVRYDCDIIREVAHARGIPLVIDAHIQMVKRVGLDGVHLPYGSRSVRSARATLGPDAIIGAFCQISRHDGMVAAESGADYVSFGPVAPTSLGDGTHATRDLFAWWSETVEISVVAEGGLTSAHLRSLAPVTDFFAVGSEIWGGDDPVTEIKELAAAIP